MFCARASLVLNQSCAGLCSDSLSAVMRQMNTHTRIPTISQDVFSCRWIGLQCSSAPWHHTQTRDTQQRYQGTYHGGDLQLNRMKPLPVEITLGFTCWRFSLYVTAIYCSSYQKKSCFHCLQVICGGEGNQPPQNPHDRPDLLILCTMLCSSWMSKASDSSLYDAVHSL